MEKINLEGVDKFIGKGYKSIAEELLNSRKNIIKTIINTRAVPDEGLDELTIELFLNMLAGMDSNNGVNHIGIGEREGRVFSNIVSRRNYSLIHGIGRSGNVNELQPKAVGSSLLVKLTCSLTQNFLHSIGMNFVKNLTVLPFATGMAITLTFLSLRSIKPVNYFFTPRTLNM
jgi:O-phospho-L-seryl-tRNASec:L-selenocysteinyl-tRNA synthase